MNHWAIFDSFVYKVWSRSFSESTKPSFVGVPKILHSDNGREFVNKLTNCVVREWVAIVNGRPSDRG